MKNVSRFLASAALAATFSLAAYAQTPTPEATPAAAATPSAQEVQAKADLYKKFLDNRSKKDAKGQPDPAAQKIAYETGKEYLTKYGSDTSEAEVKIIAFIQRFVTSYEKAVTAFVSSAACSDAAKANNPAKIFEACRPLLDKQPDDSRILLTLAQAGYLNAASPKTANKSLYPDGARYLRSAIQAVESGKVTDFAPFKSKEEILAYLNYGLGLNLTDSSPDEAVAAFLKAAQSSGTYKTLPATYYSLAGLYYKEYKKLADDYKRLYEGKDKTPESEAAYQRLNQVLDRVIDAYGRTIALSTQTDPATVAFKKVLMTDFTALYKGRHDNSDAGMTDYIAGVLAKPLPIPSEEVIPTPASTGASTPAAGTPPATGGTMPAPKSTTTTTTTTTTKTTQPANTVKPTTPPATVKPTPKPGTVPPSTQKPLSKNTGAGSKSTVGKGRQ